MICKASANGSSASMKFYDKFNKMINSISNSDENELKNIDSR